MFIDTESGESRARNCAGRIRREDALASQPPEHLQALLDRRGPEAGDVHQMLPVAQDILILGDVGK